MRAIWQLNKWLYDSGPWSFACQSQPESL